MQKLIIRAQEKSTISEVDLVRSFAAICSLCMLSLMACLPFLLPIHVDPIPSFYSEWWTVFFGLAGALVFVLFSNEIKLVFPSITFTPILLALVVALQISLGMFAYRASGFFLIANLVWVAVLIIVASSLCEKLGAKKFAIFIATSILCGGVLSSVVGCVQAAGIHHYFAPWVTPLLGPKGVGVYGNLAQQNHFANYLALALASALYLHASMTLSLRKFIPIISLLLTSAILSGSRSIWLYFAVLSGLFILLRRARNNTNAKHETQKPSGHLTRKAITHFCAFGIATFLIASQLPQFQRLFQLSETLGSRSFLWRHAVDMFFAHPILGVGFDAFAFNLIGQLQFGAKYWGIDQFAHNLILQLLAVSGILGIAAFLLPILFSIRRQRQLAFTAERFFAFCLIAILIIHSLLEQPLFFTYFLGIAVISVALLEPARWQIKVVGLTRLCASAFLFLALFLALKTMSDYLALEETFYTPQYVTDQALQQRELTAKNLHQNSFFTPYVELAAPEVFVSNEASAKEKLALNQRVRHFAPTAEVEFRHAALLAEDNQMDAAIVQFQRAATAYPYDTNNYVARFQILAESDFARYGRLAEFAQQTAVRLNQLAPKISQ